jgi:sugar/nucleoside kinase (ribokinase family)
MKSINEKKKIVCIGMALLDILISPVDDGILNRDATEVDSTECKTGGEALNEAVILSALGHDSILMGTVGNDMWGEIILKQLKERGVDASRIYVHPSLSTVTSTVLIQDNGDRSFLVHKKNCATFDMKCINKETIESADAVSIGSMYFEDELDSNLPDLLAWAKKNGALTFGDAVYHTGFSLEKIKESLPLLDYIIPNLEEAEGLTGEKDLESIAKVFLNYGVKNVIIKTGKEGCYIMNAKEIFQIPAFRVEKVVDTTGAGDSFVAGFIAGILEGRDLRDAAKFANATAAVNVQGVGATYLKNRADVEKMFMSEE